MCYDWIAVGTMLFYMACACDAPDAGRGLGTARRAILPHQEALPHIVNARVCRPLGHFQVAVQLPQKERPSGGLRSACLPTMLPCHEYFLHAQCVCSRCASNFYAPVFPAASCTCCVPARAVFAAVVQAISMHQFFQLPLARAVSLPAPRPRWHIIACK